MIRGSATVEIAAPPAEVFAAIADVTRIGEWSPECVGARWLDGADGPAVGATFAGDNRVELFGITLKSWTTTSEVTECTPGECFEFNAEHHTVWRYDLEPAGSGTRVTESYAYESLSGTQKFLYETVMRRPASMVKGMERTLAALKQSLEA